MADQSISQLPVATTITGNELTVVVQNGITKQTQVSQIANAVSPGKLISYLYFDTGSNLIVVYTDSTTQNLGPIPGYIAATINSVGHLILTNSTGGTTDAGSVFASLTQTFTTVNNETATLPNSQRLVAGANISLTSGTNTLTIAASGSAGSLNGAGTGIIVKDTSTTVIARTLTSTAGISITNPAGLAGNPIISPSLKLADIQNLATTGILAVVGGTTVVDRNIVGTASQITVVGGDGSANPTISIATNPVLPGTGSTTLPTGTTAQRPGALPGQIRFNTTLNVFEGQDNSGTWQTLALGGGVTSITLGTGLTGSPNPITSTGTISITATGVTAATYGSSTQVPVFAVNAQGQITSVTNTTITAGGLGAITAVNGTANEITSSQVGTVVTVSLPTALTFTGKTVTDGTFNMVAATVGSDTVTTNTATQTLTNKTLTLPTIGSTGAKFNGSTSGTTTVVATAIAGTTTLTLPAATDTLVGKATTDTLTNKTLTLPTIGGTGAKFNGSSSGSTTVVATAVAGTTTLTLPAATDTLVGKATTDTLTNKSISGATNTFTSIPNSGLTNSSITLGTTNIALGGTALTPAGLTSVTVTQDPVAALDLATKQYVDAVAQGLDPKASCVAATTANITLSGTQTIDGVALIAGDRCLVKNQTTTANNGIYVVAAGTWTRSLDMDVWAEVPGAFTFIEQGTTQADTGWVCTSNAGGTIGVTAITFVQFSGAGTYSAGTGLTLTGTQFSITNTAVTAAAYGSATQVGTFTVNAQGQLTLAGNTTVTPAVGSITGLGTGVATALAVNTGSAGAFVVNGGALGTPSSGTLTNATGLPVSTGISGLGTGVATALGVNVGTAGAFVVNGGALGTPSSGTVTNLTGTASININGTVGATTASTGAFTTISGTGQLTLTNASNYNLYASGAGANYMAGSLGIGTTTLTGFNLRINKSLTGSTTSYNISSQPTIASDVTSQAIINYSGLITAASAFTLTSATHYFADQNIIGAGSAITTQNGYFVSSSLTGATNNYGFYGGIAAATGRYNLYMVGTADNYLAGALGIGSTSLTGFNFRVDKALTGSTNSLSIASLPTIQSDVTSSAVIFDSKPSTQAAAFTLTSLFHFAAEFATIGATSAITTQYGFIAQSSLTGATNNYGFYGNIAAATGRYNLYMAGTADNYLAGILGIGTLGYAGSYLTIGGTYPNSGGNTFPLGITGTISSSATNVQLIRLVPSTQAASFTVSDLIGTYYAQGSFGASSAVTNQYGFYVENTVTGASNNFAFRGNIAAATGRYNLYMGGTADNYLAGNLGIGTTTTTAAQLTVAGSSSIAALKVPNIKEVATISATAATGTINYDVTTQSVQYYTTNASGNFTINFRASSGTTMNTLMAVGESMSFTFMNTNGATAYYNSAVQIDGTTTGVTTKWQGGTAPTAGNASSTDIYNYVVVKTASTPTYSVFASITKFA
jgi:hypothetical protein